MKRRSNKALHRASIISVLVLAAVAGCGPGQVNTGITGERTLIEASAEQTPGWVTREPESDNQYHYFRGIRTDAPTLEAAEGDARQNALAGIVQFLGLRVTVDYQRLRTEERTAIEDAIRSVGGADIAGTRLSEFYYRRWRVNEGDRVRYLFDGFAMVRLPRASVERIQQGQQERLRNIQQMLAGPGFMARPSEIAAQITNASQALSAVNELNQSVLITTQTSGQADQIRRQAVTRLTRLVSSLQVSVAAVPERVTAGRQPQPLVLRVSVTQDDRGIPAPVPQMPVKISLGEGDNSVSQVVWTDTRGIAEWDLHEINVAGTSTPVTAQVQLPEGARTVNDLATSVPTATTTLSIVDATSLVKVLVAVREQVSGEDTGQHFAEARIVEALSEAGFEVVAPGQLPSDAVAGDPWKNTAAAAELAASTGANMILSGSISVSEPTPVARMRGVFFCTASAELVLSSVRTGQVVASIPLPDDVVRDTKGFGNSPERAAQNALMLARGRGRQPNGYTHIAEQIRSAVAGN